MHRTKLATEWVIAASTGLLVALLSLLFVSRTAGDLRTVLPRDLSETAGWRIYDSHPDHIWNRLHRSLYLRVARDGREYGHDELDPLLWCWPASARLIVDVRRHAPLIERSSKII